MVYANNRYINRAKSIMCCVLIIFDFCCLSIVSKKFTLLSNYHPHCHYMHHSVSDLAMSLIAVFLRFFL